MIISPSNGWIDTSVTSSTMYVTWKPDAQVWTVNNTGYAQTITYANTSSQSMFTPADILSAKAAMMQHAADMAPVRRAPPREFNEFINASDKLEEFIRWLGTEGVKQSEVMAIPLELFVKWLIIRACEKDGEEPGVTLQLPARTARCLGCQKFMRRAPVPFHGERCASFYYRRAA